MEANNLVTHSRKKQSTPELNTTGTSLKGGPSDLGTKILQKY